MSRNMLQLSDPAREPVPSRSDASIGPGRRQAPGTGHKERLARFSIGWNRPIENETLLGKILEQVLIEKIWQLFKDML
jgi:hypothetical protein